MHLIFARRTRNEPDRDSYRVTTLKNGIRVLSISTDRFVGVYGVVDFAVGTRDMYLLGRPPGLIHATEHMTFKRARRWQEKAILEICDRLGVNAWTDMSYWSMEWNSHTNHWNEAVSALATIAREVKFRRAVVDGELSVIRNEWRRQLDDNNDILEQELYRLLFPRSAMSTQPGSIRGLASLPVSAYRWVLRESLQGSRMVIGAIGNIEHEELVREVQHSLGDLPCGVPYPPINLKARGGYRHRTRDVKDPYFTIGWQFPGIRSKRYLAGQMLASAAIDTEASELWYKLRALGSYGITHDFHPYPELSVFFARGTIESKELSPYLELYIQWFRRVAFEGISPELLELTKLVKQRELRDLVNTPEEELRRSIRFLRVHKRPPPSYLSREQQIERISNTDIIKAADLFTTTPPGVVVLSRAKTTRLSRPVRNLLGG